jgi:tetratricopeptide (TPR) repeat protein
VAKAIEERRRRKVQLALAASVLALTTLGGLSTTYYLQQRAARAAAGQRAIDQVTTLQGQALAHPEEIQRWEIALAAVERADPVGDSNTKLRLVGLQEQITAGLVVARRDKVLLDRLVDIRSAEADDPGGSATDAAYADAFREAGIDLESLTPAEAGAKIRARPPSVALALAGALDDWASQRRRARPNDKESWRRLSDAARVADPDPWRNELRTALDQSDKAARLTALQTLAKTAKFELLGAISLHLLGTGLNDAGDSARAESVLRTAQERHPSDVWVNYALGAVLDELSRRNEAIRFYTAARAIRPETAHELAHALAKRGDSEESIAVFRDLKGLKPGNIRHLSCLGTELKAKGHSREADETLEAAVAAGRRAIELRPNDEWAHFQLGLALAEQGNPHEAVAEWRTAIRLRPGHVEAHSNLATALSRQGKLDEAMDEWRETIRLNPELAYAHSGKGGVLRDQGKFDEAIATYREAMRLKPDLVEPHNNLGMILSDQGKLDEAAAEFRTTIRLEPDLAAPHYNLGLVLASQDKLDEAMSEWQVVIRLDPGFAEAYCNHGTALQQRGAYAEALEMYRKGHELGSRRPDWRYPSAEWLAAAERQMALSKRFPAMLRGEDPPKDNTERVALAQHASGRARFALATRLLAQALESDPKLGDDREAQLRYAAACDAILGANGQDKDEPPPDDDSKARLRRQALEWLRTELSAWGKMIESGQPHAGAVVSVRLQNWKENDALAGVRIADRLARFSPDEQKAWRSLWADVDSLLRRAATLDATEKSLSTIQSRARALESSKPGEAEPLLREAMELTRKQFGTADPRTVGAMAQLGNSLIQQGKWSAAEPVLRECLAIREKNQPAEWTTFNTRSMLGGSLLGQKKYAEAEPLIVSGYEGMKAREARIPPPGKPRFTDAAERVVKLYEAWDKPEKAAEWRARLSKPSDEANKPHP